MGKDKEMIKEIYKKYEEIIKYLFFGVATTFVGWAVYFLILICGKEAYGLPAEDTTSATYLAIYTAAQVIQWIAAVLFAFFTNRKWVFTKADKEVPIAKQLPVFAGGRVLTFLLDYVVTYFGAIALCNMIPAFNNVDFAGREWNLNEIGAKVVAAVIVIIGNYFFSKLLVFRGKKEEKDEK